ncbi:MAG: GNAT family N-acetyltransferase [Cyanobacteria bacterium SZAS LIN-5]|nr:GNAT family N-acetyltransferase [Cyanobacteria bacterium SZAS LIN-5]RTL40397.1 MAG: GNAT family N-acetyltransferase [Candidatus Melainabacteria bacterium]
MSTEVIIRPAKDSDLDAIAKCIEPFVAEKKILRRTFSELQSLIPSYVVAEADGEIIGCVVLEVYSPKLAEVRSLVVAREYGGRGIGKRLVNACVEKAKEEGVFEVMAITSEDLFFQSCGFDFTLPGEKKALFYLTRQDM